MRFAAILCLSSVVWSQASWKSDWAKFHDALEKCTETSNCALEPTSVLKGSVTWKGKLQAITARSQCPIVADGTTGDCIEIRMPDVPSIISGGGTYAFSTVTAFASPAGLEVWKKLPIGSDVQFQATISRVKFTFHPTSAQRKVLVVVKDAVPRR